MPREMMFAEGIAVAITEEMQRDANVVFYGQNMAMTDRDPFVRKFGKDRVRITPISETAELGIAIGAAMMGLRPIVELYMAEFMLVAFDEVINEAPRLRYMSGGQVKVPTVFKAGIWIRGGMGRAALELYLRRDDGNSGAEDRCSVECSGRLRTDEIGDTRRQSGCLFASLHADAG